MIVLKEIYNKVNKIKLILFNVILLNLFFVVY